MRQFLFKPSSGHICSHTLCQQPAAATLGSHSVHRRRHRSRRTRITPTARLPSKGYFAEADTKAEIYSRAPKKFDPAKKPTRWEPEFIWQTNWQEALKYEQDLKQQAEKKAEEEAQKTSGRLSLSRLAELDSLDPDLSPKLLSSQLPPSTSSSPQYLSLDIFAAKNSAGVAPSRMEERKWRRAATFSGVGATAGRPTLDEPDEASIAAEREAYAKLKLELQAWTFLITGCGFAVSYEFYSQNVAVSYVVGALTGLFYLRQLNNSTDSMGGTGMKALSGVLSQPRLLIPAAMVVVYSKWNSALAEPTGVQLQLIPMLLGFFSYKAAMVGKQAWSIMSDMSQDVQGPYESNGQKGVQLTRRGVGRESATRAQTEQR